MMHDELPANTGLRMSLAAALQALRPQQWIKNVIVFAPLLFAVRIGDRQAWIRESLAALAFCFAASAVYIFNDLCDQQRDRHHPLKRLRPIASGRLRRPAAVVEIVLLLAAAATVAWGLGIALSLVVLAYLMLQTAYNMQFKRRVLLDAITLACGFVLRAVGGAVAIHVTISPWLIICTFSLCLFLGFAKRQCEICTFDGSETAGKHRNTLVSYTPALLNHLITLSGGVAIVCFLLYATSERTLHEFGTNYFIYTIPLIFYGICRVAMLAMRGSYEGPTELFLHDRAIQLTAIAWLLMASVIVLRGAAIQQWLLEHL